MIKKKIRVRIGPSPTGLSHIGTGYIALLNYAFAKKNNGNFILRIEDTDKKRCFSKYEKDILQSLKWLNLNWDEGPDIGGNKGPYRQSERINIYKKYINILLNKNKAYICTCSTDKLNYFKKKQIYLKQSTSYNGFCREKKIPIPSKNSLKSFVIRLKTPKEGSTSFIDILRGKITIQNSELNDQVLQKSDGLPTYHIANIIDDYLMEISHVIRGEEWISSTPKHVLLYKALKIKPPHFIHLPLLRNTDKSKVSKRKNPISLKYFRESGYFPEALCNFLGLMTFSLKNNQEVFNKNEFIKNFSINKISLKSPIFDIKKLTWLNGKYLREKKSSNDIVKYLQQQLFSTKYLEKIVPLIKNRIEKSEDFIKHTSFFFIDYISNKPIDLIIRHKNKQQTIIILKYIIKELNSLTDYSSIFFKKILITFCKKNKIEYKNLLMSLRIIITGSKNTPPLFKTINILGIERCKVRIIQAIKTLKL